MRISDWSSDVCSSDLLGGGILQRPGIGAAAVDQGEAGAEKIVQGVAVLQIIMRQPRARPSGRPVTVGIEGRFRRAVGRYDRRSGIAIAMLDAPAFIFGIAEALDLLRHMVPGLIVVRRGRGSGPYGDVDK